MFEYFHNRKRPIMNMIGKVVFPTAPKVPDGAQFFFQENEVFNKKTFFLFDLEPL